jgi:hypothetical protein
VEGRVGRTTFSARFCPNIGAESVVEGMMALPGQGYKKNNKTLYGTVRIIYNKKQ